MNLIDDMQDVSDQELVEYWQVALRELKARGWTICCDDYGAVDDEKVDHEEKHIQLS